MVVQPKSKKAAANRVINRFMIFSVVCFEVRLCIEDKINMKFRGPLQIVILLTARIFKSLFLRRISGRAGASGVDGLLFDNYIKKYYFRSSYKNE